MSTGLPLKFCFSCWDKALQLRPEAVCAVWDFIIQEACWILARIVFKAEKRNVLYLVVTQMDVPDKHGSARSYPVSLPEAYIFTVRSLLFLLFHANKPPDHILFFSYAFYCFLIFSSHSFRDPIQRMDSILLLSPLCLVFSFISLFFTFLSHSLSLLHLSTRWCLVLLLPLLSLPSLCSHFLSHSSLLPLTKVLAKGNEKCMYSVVVQCGSRRENCCFMVLFMDL